MEGPKTAKIFKFPHGSDFHFFDLLFFGEIIRTRAQLERKNMELGKTESKLQKEVEGLTRERQDSDLGNCRNKFTNTAKG
jgi:hypothetical protein